MANEIRSMCETRAPEVINDGAGTQISRAFPSWTRGSFDPFILLDDFHIREGGGFPYHAHMGFEKITYVVDGRLEHEDSLGNKRVLDAGGAHWLMTGRGVNHSEFPYHGCSTRGIQLWLNIPRMSKEANPAFQSASSSELPVCSFTGGQAKVIAGGKSPLQLQSGALMMEITFTEPALYRMHIPDKATALVYVLKGQASILQKVCPSGELSVLGQSGDLEVTAEAGCTVLVMAGLPLGEPFHLSGSFVD